MFSKRGVIRTDAIEQDIGTPTPPRDSGALSGILAGISFIGGVGGAMALADYPYPRLGSEPAEIRRYFTQSSHAARLSAAGQFVSAASLIPFTASVLRLAGRTVGPGIA